MAGGDKKASGNDIIDQRTAAPVHVDHKADRQQEYEGEDDGIDQCLGGSIKGKQYKEKIENGIGKEKIFETDDPFVEPGVIAGDLEETTDKTEIDIIGQDEEGLSEVDRQ